MPKMTDEEFNKTLDEIANRFAEKMMQLLERSNERLKRIEEGDYLSFKKEIDAQYRRDHKVVMQAKRLFLEEVEKSKKARD